MTKLPSFRNFIWPILTIVILGCRDVKNEPQTSGGNKEDFPIHEEVEINEAYTQKGLTYMKSTQAVLGKNLIEAIKSKGPAGAVVFCNTRAIKLTDSMAQNHKVYIGRVTDKPRNPKNKANDEQLGYLRSYISDQELVNTYEPLIVRKEKEVNFYYPIVTNAMCIQCHGTPKEHIQPETLRIIQDLYPYDLAQGYSMNDVRGMWYIQFTSAVD